MDVVALAGGIGAGKFLRGLVRVVQPENLTVVVNTADDIVLHGLHVSPDLDSVTYWLAGVMDRERGWGRDDDTFRATSELERLGASGSWFGLGDLDLATHLFRTACLSGGNTLTEVTGRIAERFGVRAKLLPMTDDPVTTRILGVDPDTGEEANLHFQEYWVRHGGRHHVKEVRYEGAAEAVPAPGVLEALAATDAVIVCPSNPVASIQPILAVGDMRRALSARRERAVGISPIVGGAPILGMADRLMPAVGIEVTAAGAAGCYEGLIAAWVMDERDRQLVPAIETAGIRVAVTGAVMVDDDAAEALARVALELL